FVATVIVTDDDNGVVSVASQAITVDNANPEVTITGAPVGQSSTSNATLPQGQASWVQSTGFRWFDDQFMDVGEDGNPSLRAGVMKWTLPNGMTADDVDGATLKLYSMSSAGTPRQI